MFVGCWICAKKIGAKSYDLPRKKNWNDTVSVCKECYERFKDDYKSKEKNNEK